MASLPLVVDIQVKREFNYRDCYAQAEYHHHGHHGHHHHHPGAHPGSLTRGDGPQGPLPTYQRRGSLQLWQFLVALLDDPANTPYIAWTGRGLEFKLIEPEEVSVVFLCVNCESTDLYSFENFNKTKMRKK